MILTATERAVLVRIGMMGADGVDHNHLRAACAGICNDADFSRAMGALKRMGAITISKFGWVLTAEGRTVV